MCVVEEQSSSVKVLTVMLAWLIWVGLKTILNAF